jgi:disulfide bond formation protein DsbB
MIAAMTLSPRPIALVLLVASLAALGVGLGAQYLFGLRPCDLCLIQRVPFVLAAGLAAVALRVPASLLALARIAALALLVNGAIAFYHVGVEHHWWASAVCGASDAAPTDINDLARMMERPVEARCDQPAWSLGGVSMAGINLMYSGGLGLGALILLRRRAQ